jgi:hypothetical protein
MAKEKTGESVMIRKVLVGICAFSLMYSCSKDDVLPAVDPATEEDQVTDGDPVAAVFASSFVKQDWVGPGSAGDRPETRVWDDQWTGGEEIGIYMIKKTDSFDLSKAMFKNKKYTVKASADPGILPPTGEIDYAASDKMYYPPKSTTTVQFVAYCPYDASGDNMAVYTFTDQDPEDGTGKEAADFIFHKATTEYSKDPSTPVELNFKHKFSKIRIDVRPEEDSDLTIENLIATLTGIPTSATVNLATLAANENDVPAAIAYGAASTSSTPIKPYVISKDEDLVELEVIVPPHSGTGTRSFSGREFNFDINGKECTYELPDTTTFRPGKEYKYELTLIAKTANCYMVAPGATSEAIPISRARQYGGMPAEAEVELEILWDDNNVISATPTLTGSKFTVTTTDNPGNAVIGIKDKATGDIYWSWHIWVTDYDPDNEELVWINPNSPTYTFMDRNLGATEAELSLAGRGLLYQWGRKDPFPGTKSGTAGYASLDVFEGMSDAGTPGPFSLHGLSQTNALLQSIRNPKRFYRGESSNNGYNWLPSFDASLWNKDNNKTIYDPCPLGWRVPAVFDGVTPPYDGLHVPGWNPGDTGGVNLGKNAKFPAPGYREYWQGTPTVGGIQFRNMTANADATNATYGLENACGAPNQRLDLRLPTACSVRCVKE